MLQKKSQVLRTLGHPARRLRAARGADLLALTCREVLLAVDMAFFLIHIHKSISFIELHVTDLDCGLRRSLIPQMRQLKVSHMQGLLGQVLTCCLFLFPVLQREHLDLTPTSVL